MELSTEIKTKDCDMDCECKDCEMQRENDDQNIHVCVSPRRFGLPTSREKKTKMEIKNKNPYPIYFKANTSNMDAFRPQPDCGCIAPNSKVSVDVQFYNSARPLRCHEEVIVFTSVKPFEQFALYEQQICPYCLEPFSFSKHHNHKQQIHSEKYFPDQEHQSCKKDKILTKRLAKNRTNLKSSEDEEYVRNYVVPKHKQKTEHGQKHTQPKLMQLGKSKDTKKTQEEIFDNECSRQNEINQNKQYAYKRFWTLGARKIYSDEKVDNDKKYSDETISNRKILSDEKVNDKRRYFREDNKKDFSTRRTKHMDGSCKLKEICIHAFVHKPSAGGCECGNCVELGFDKDNKLEQYLISNEYDDVKRMKNIEESRNKTEKEIHVVRDKNDAANYKNSKEKLAHILTRILRAEDEKAGTSETTSDSTELNSKDIELLARRAKIMSEEDYKTKKEKLHKKMKKIYKEESESTSIADVPENKDPKTGKKCTGIKRRSTLEILEKKCRTILRLSWLTVLLLILLILIIFGCCVFFGVSDNRGKEYMFPCFYNYYLQDFE